MAVYAVLDLGFGDAGKGSVIDALTRRINASLVVRHHGSCQAAHHVVTDDGRTHCFAQFGSGTLAGARTHVSRFMLVEPLGLLREGVHLKDACQVSDPFSLLTIDPAAPVITPFHRLLNRLRELSRGEARHGSCGVGAGELQAEIDQGRDVLRFGDLVNKRLTCELLAAIRDRLRVVAINLPTRMTRNVERLYADFDESTELWRSVARAVATMVRHSSELPMDDRPVIFEGAQSILLDQSVGFHPYTSWSDCTLRNAETLLREAAVPADVVRIGVLRSFATRHGPGPFPTEDPSLSHLVADDHNKHGEWQGAFRVGHFDAQLAAYALRACGGVSSLALTHIDKVRAPWWLATEYPLAVDIRDYPKPLHQQIALTEALRDVTSIPLQSVASAGAFVSIVQALLRTPVGIVSTGPTAAAKEFRRLTVQA